MPITISMPALSPTMTEGNLAKWHKQEGDSVRAGDVLAEIETDKATMEIEAVDEGILGKILVPAGTEAVKVNIPIAILLEEGEDRSALQVASAPPRLKKDGLPASSSAPHPEAMQPAQSGAKASASPVNSHQGERIFASPLARRIATEAGIALDTLKGTGPHGRIVKADIETAIQAGKAPSAAKLAAVTQPAAATPLPPKAPSPSAVAGLDALLPPYEEVTHTPMRRVIAQRLMESKRDAPHFYLTIDCELDTLLKLRADLNARGGDLKLSVNDFCIKAAALALKKVPAANASWTENATRLYQGADISVAVAIPNGLITPVIRAAETKGLATISREMKEMAQRAREGKLKPEEYQGGTFSLSNLGMFGIRQFSAVINPPQGAILAIGAGEQRPVVRGGALAIATVMTCTLSVDHRAVDGAVGAEYLVAFRQLVEDPISMIL